MKECLPFQKSMDKTDDWVALENRFFENIMILIELYENSSRLVLKNESVQQNALISQTIITSFLIMSGDIIFLSSGVDH